MDAAAALGNRQFHLLLTEHSSSSHVIADEFRCVHRGA